MSQLLVTHDGESADHIAVSVEKLGAAVQDNVAPQFKRPLQVGCHKGVVNQGDDAVFPGDCRCAFQVGNFQERIGGGLQVDAPGFRADSSLERSQVGCVDKGRFDAHPAENSGKHPVRPAVHIVADHQVVAGREDHQGRGYGRHARCKGKTAAAVFQIGHGLFKRFTGRIVTPGIIVFSEVVDRCLPVG